MVETKKRMMLEVTCSGSFRTSPATDQNRYDFNDVKVVIPECSDEYILSHTMRMFPIAKRANKSLEGKTFNGLIKLYIDGVETIEGSPDCCGKNIKEMTWEELQSLACLMNLREIPMYRQGAIRTAQEKAYEIYQAKVLNRRVFKQPKDIANFQDNLRRNMEAMMMTEDDIKQRIDAEMAKAFNMIVNSQNLKESYNFSKVDDIIIPAYNPEDKKLRETK